MGLFYFTCLLLVLSYLKCVTHLKSVFFRRFVWNFFRLENEHLNNCGKFRAVRDISVAPIDSGDQTQILRMMDDENGVLNRKPHRKSVKKVKEDRRPLITGESVSEMGITVKT